MSYNWQQHFKTWNERIAHIQTNDIFPDFQFIVGPDKKVFNAHKRILAAVSPYFENLFYLNKIDMEQIELTDHSPEVFEDFISFIYTDVLHLTSENVEEIIKLSRLYTMTTLAGKCDYYLKQIVDKENVMKLLDLSTQNNFKHSTRKCLKIIDENSGEIFDTQEFIEITKKSIEKIVDYQMMSCNEILLIKAVNKWSEFQCSMKQKEVTLENKRSEIGDLIFKIHFGSLCLEDLNNLSNENSFFTKNEINDFSKLNFQKRIGQLTVGRCFRFSNGSDANRGISENFNISVNKNLFLCGFGVFGKTTGELNNDAIQFTLKNEDGKVLVKLSKDFTCDESETAEIYEIFFEMPIILEQSKMYNIEVYRKGPRGVHSGFYKKDGEVMEENGVVFEIFRATEDINALERGLIASFIYRC